jgi:hypothetical protein
MNLTESQLSQERLMHHLIFQSFFLYPFLYLQVTDKQNKSFVNFNYKLNIRTAKCGANIEE